MHRASVYRTLEALCEMGVVQHVHTGHGGAAYHLIEDDDVHLHAQCRQCGALLDVPIEGLSAVAQRLRRKHGFALDPGHVALSGTCRDCRQGASSR